ncbi:MAG TPA: protein kinase [Planctomycetota bacterium]|nr:protein kinase [Planctomycetota bacterium]
MSTSSHNRGRERHDGAALPLELELQLSACIVASGTVNGSQLKHLVARHPAWRERFSAWLERFEHRRDPDRGVRRLARYSLLREIGRGGMGVVHLAWDEDTHRWVAVKILQGASSEPDMRLRFEREARTLARLRHPSIVPVYEIGDCDGMPFFVMDLVRGAALDDFLAGCRDKDKQADRMQASHLAAFVARTVGTPVQFEGSYERAIATICAEAAGALHAAHVQGIVHRDVKPGNLMIGADGGVRVLDFGLARLEFDQSLTRSSDVMGTPMYLAPEQIVGAHDVDARADVYSLGVTLYELIALRHPHYGVTLAALYHEITHVEPPPLTRWNPAVSADLAAIVRKAMEKDRGDRYATMADLQRDLQAFAAGAAVSVRPASAVRRTLRRLRRHRTRLLAGLAAVALLAASLVYMFALRGGIDAVRIVAEVRALRMVDSLGALEDLRKKANELTGAERSEVLAMLERHAESFASLQELRRSGAMSDDLRREWADRLPVMLDAYRIEAQQRLGEVDEHGAIDRLLAADRAHTMSQLGDLERQALALAPTLRHEIEDRLTMLRGAAQTLADLGVAGEMDRETLKAWRARVAGLPAAYATAAEVVLAGHESGLELCEQVRASGIESEADLQAMTQRARLLPPAYRDSLLPMLEADLASASRLREVREALDRGAAVAPEQLQQWRSGAAAARPCYAAETRRLLDHVELLGRIAPGSRPQDVERAERGELPWGEPLAEAQWALAREHLWPTRVRDPRTGVTFALIPGTTIADTKLDAFYLAQTEITWEQWGAGAVGGSVAAVEGDVRARPVAVSFVAAIAFCERFGYRLPREAEWQRACSAGAGEPLARVAWFRGNYREPVRADVGGRVQQLAAPVGRLEANAAGLQDMLGNVWEWCAPDDAAQAAPGRWQVVRGGAFDSYAAFCTDRQRLFASPDREVDNVGFRPAVSLP